MNMGFPAYKYWWCWDFTYLLGWKKLPDWTEFVWRLIFLAFAPQWYYFKSCLLHNVMRYTDRHRHAHLLCTINHWYSWRCFQSSTNFSFSSARFLQLLFLEWNPTNRSILYNSILLSCFEQAHQKIFSWIMTFTVATIMYVWTCEYTSDPQTT